MRYNVFESFTKTRQQIPPRLMQWDWLRDTFYEFERIATTYVVVILAALSLVHGIIYAVVIPPWQAPDETGHFEHVRLVYEKRRPISKRDVSAQVRAEIVASMVQNHFAELTQRASAPPTKRVDDWQRARNHLDSSHGEFHQPPLYYAMGALALYLISPKDVTTQLYVVRLVSVILGALVVLVAYSTIRLLFPEDLGLWVAVSAFILFLPMHAHISSAVNNDNLAELMASIAIALLVLSVRYGLSVIRLGALGLVLMSGLFSKTTFVFVFPLALIAVMAAAMMHPPRYRSWLVAGGLLALAFLALMVAGGPSLLTSRWWRTGMLRLALGFPRDWSAMWQVLQERYLWYAESMFEGFWARFGWYSTRLDSVWYWLLAGICLAAAGGSVLFAFRCWRSGQLQRWQWMGVSLLALPIGLVVTQTVLRFLSGNASWEGDTSLPQGRFLFPAIIPIALFLVLGWRELFPRRYHRQALVIIVAGSVLFDILILVGHVIPFYYGRIAAASPADDEWFVYLPVLTREWEAGTGRTSPTPTMTPTPKPSATLMPSPSPAPSVTPTPVSRPVWGVAFSVVTLDTSNGNLAAAADMGATHVRLIVSWANIEPSRGQRDWSGYDRLIQRVTGAGLSPIVEIRNIPAWARKPEEPWQSVNCGLMADNEYVSGPSSGFWSFMRDLVERSDGDGIGDLSGLAGPVKLWEMGNEPESSRRDGEHFGLCYGPIRDPDDPTDLDKADYGPARKYTELLRVATDAIHTADPDGLSVFGGMMYMVIPSWGLDSPRWLNEVLGASQSTDFDVMNIHAFHAVICEQTVPDRVAEVRQQMADYGMGKPVVITEAGWPDNQTACGVSGSLERQSWYVVQLYIRGIADNLSAVTWFALKDFFQDVRYGLMEQDGTPKPGYWAFKTLTEELAGAGYERALAAADTGWADVEGYSFRTADGRAKWVLWTPIQPQDVTRPVTFPWARVRVVQAEKYEGANGTPVAGSVQEVADGDPNDLLPGDGRVTLSLAGSPIYVEDVSQ